MKTEMCNSNPRLFFALLVSLCHSYLHCYIQIHALFGVTSNIRHERGANVLLRANHPNGQLKSKGYENVCLYAL
jgi:hypothetical protein